MVVLISGGFSTQLANYVDEKVMTESPLWSSQFLASNPDAVIKTHCDYIKAGAEVITTNTYQASVDGFQKHLGLDYDKSVALIKEGVFLAHKAIKNSKVDRQVLVAGSVGPYGACLCDGSEYRGDYIERTSEVELMAWHRPRISAMVEAGVDVLAVETCPALEEARAVLRLLREEFPNTKAWVSFTCKDESHISYKELFRDVVTECIHTSRAQLMAVGVNCVEPALVSPLIKTVQDLQVPFIAYPNLGETWTPGVGWTNTELCLPLVHYLPEWLSLGVQYIGGCCRTNADDIKKMREYLDSHNI